MHRRTMLGVLLALTCALPVAAAQKLGPGKAAPEFKLHELDGGQVTLSELKGQVVVLHFWDSNCSPCNAEVPYLQKLHQEYGAQGVHVFGLAELDRTEAQLHSFIKQFKTTYPILVDPDSKVGTKYGVSSHPVTVIVGRDGNIRWWHNGFVKGDEKKLSEALRTVLKGGQIAAIPEF